MVSAEDVRASVHQEDWGLAIFPTLPITNYERYALPMAQFHLRSLACGLFVLLMGAAVPAGAITPAGEQMPPEQPIAPPEGQEPEVTVIQRPHMTITEYRSGGRVYMIRIDPEWGPAYYLVDGDQDGRWNDRLGPQIRVPEWTLFEW